MTPDPYVRTQGLILAFVLLSVGAAGIRVLAIVGSLLTLVIWVRLVQPYLRRRKQFTPPSTSAVTERSQLDRLMMRVALGAIASGPIGVAAGLAAGTANVTNPSVIAGSAAVVLIAGGVYWSSLVDWYWVLPRVSGLLGHRSCRSEPESGGATVSWEGVTRWWLTHRIVSAIAVAVGASGLTAAVTAGVAAAAGAKSIGQVMAAALAAFIVAGITIYRQFAAAAFPLAMRPETYVGVAYKDRDLGPVWPVDVGLEGIGVVTEQDHRARHLAYELGNGPQFFHRKSDASVPLSEVVARRRGAASMGCSADSCSGLSWYCVQNDLAWRKPAGS